MRYAFKYRLPGAKQYCAGFSNHCLRAPLDNGFLISPFIPGSQSYFIPSETACGPDLNEMILANGHGTLFPIPNSSTSRNQHKAEIEAIVEAEKSGALTKAVAARCVVIDRSPDIDVAFGILCDKYPDAFIFFFSTPETGSWIGATPEVLLENKQGNLRTMALAGTRRTGSTGKWDKKNIDEQAIVTEFILQCLAGKGCKAETFGPNVVAAGPVEHLRTDIHCPHTDDIDLLSLIDSLSPTSALCGMPRDTALRVISQNEDFSRGLYGGYCGPWTDNKNFNLYVILRCAKICRDSTCLFAGGGIMPDSDPDSEWEETEAKLSTLLNLII